MFKIEMKNKYKIFISIIFGFLGFFINLHTIIFPLGDYTAAILLGLLFPILITLSWGWKYGLLSALAGGCQTMWWLWGPSNGYAIFFVVPPFTLWIIWHGIFAGIREKQNFRKWWLSMYIVEIPFRILSSINLLTICRWAVTLNPPPWNWCSNAPNTIPLDFSIFVVIKQAAVGFIVLLLADVLLNLRHIRRFLKLKEEPSQINTGYIISASLLLGTLFWVFDSFFSSIAFFTDKSFIDLLVLNIPSYILYVRTAFIIACLIGGVLAAGLLRKQLENKIALQESETKYKTLYDSSRDAIMILTKKQGFISGNTAAVKMFKCKDEQELISKNPIDLSPEYQLDGILSKIKAKQMMQIALEKDSHFFEWKHKRIDGKEFFANVLLTKIELKGKELLQATVRDISERWETEEKLKKRNQQLEAFNKIAIDRELKMIELKKNINELLKKSGKKPYYTV
jgi:PAS domain S-box-containing protein